MPCAVNPELQAAGVYDGDGQLLAGFRAAAPGCRPLPTGRDTSFGDGYHRCRRAGQPERRARWAW